MSIPPLKPPCGTFVYHIRGLKGWYSWSGVFWWRTLNSIFLQNFILKEKCQISEMCLKSKMSEKTAEVRWIYMVAAVSCLGQNKDSETRETISTACFVKIFVTCSCSTACWSRSKYFLEAAKGLLGSQVVNHRSKINLYKKFVKINFLSPNYFEKSCSNEQIFALCT